MERPLSAASSTTTPSTTSGPTHRRNASAKSITRPAGSTVVSLFIRNLRLLNLDLLSDWPNITVTSFSNQDARTKIKCTEYALFHLFKLYDPATTADKLQPFFPPLEPLQSVNLRSALFRCLNELKKSGVLPKETVLRKTMLDECQGDKFWEVLFVFSAIVLRKAIAETRAKHNTPWAEKIGTSQTASKSQRDSMLPLAIAHKAALSKVLDEKARKRDTYVGLYDLLAEKENELRQRKAKSELRAHQIKGLRQDKLNAVEKAIQKSWVGSTDLKDALIDGDTCAKGDGMLVQSFDRVWQRDEFMTRPNSSSAEVGLLQRISSKAAEQSIRLRRWQAYHDQIVASRPVSSRASRPTSIAHKPMPRFDRHRDLTLRDASPESDRQPASPRKTTRERHDSVTRYDEILTAMREELRKNSGQRAKSNTAQLPPIQALKRAQTQPVPARHPNVSLDTSPGAKDSLNRTTSQTEVPFRPRMGRRVSSQSRSYDKPKVDSQREPIPLKAELFSPLKEKRRSSVSPSFAMSILPSPSEEDDLPDEKIDSAVGDDKKVVSKDGLVQSKVTGGTQRPAAMSNGNSPTSNGSPTSVEDKIAQEVDSKTSALPAKKTAVRPSLAERTRMSIAFNSSDEITGFLPDQAGPESPASNEALADLPPVSEQDEPFDRRASLLERTRQSISLAPKTKKPTHTRTRTSVYPVNQFDTPQKARRSTVGVEGTRDITPMEDLMSPGTEYDSIFKSRPKIALSPVLSPYRDTEAMDGDAPGTPSSPLVGVGARE